MKYTLLINLSFVAPNFAQKQGNTILEVTEFESVTARYSPQR